MIEPGDDVCPGVRFTGWLGCAKQLMIPKVQTSKRIKIIPCLELLDGIPIITLIESNYDPRS
jgi:hypothetical protein